MQAWFPKKNLLSIWVEICKKTDNLFKIDEQNILFYQNVAICAFFGAKMEILGISPVKPFDKFQKKKSNGKHLRLLPLGVRPSDLLMAIFSRLCLPYLFPLQWNPIYKILYIKYI